MPGKPNQPDNRLTKIHCNGIFPFSVKRHHNAVDLTDRPNSTSSLMLNGFCAREEWKGINVSGFLETCFSLSVW